MTEPVDEFLTKALAGLHVARDPSPAGADPGMVLQLFDAQIQSRHIDLAARWLQSLGAGYYTIGSSGHEANAAVGLLTRVNDPALLHYRSGGFYAGRAARHAHENPTTATTPIRDVLLGHTSAAADPISGGRHKVFGHPALNIIPQTSTIASHLPRAVGVGLAIGGLRLRSIAGPWPEDAIVVCSFGDASLNHSTAQGALNAAAYLTHRGIATPVLFVCEDNAIGISTRTPVGWVERSLHRLPGLPYLRTDGQNPAQLLRDVAAAVEAVRATRSPGVLHLRTVRFMGHAGSDAEVGYRTQAEISADYERDPILACARYLVAHGILTAAQVAERYDEMRNRVVAEAAAVVDERRLEDRVEVMRPLTMPATVDRSRWSRYPTKARDGRLPEAQSRMTLAQAINAGLADVLEEYPHALVFGEDVAVKGGVYGVTRGLRKRFGGSRVFDTLLDEQTILGTALGTALAGRLPIPEIQYLAYLHNAEDQLRGEAASLPFFSNDQYRNPMVVRIPGLAYQKGFGGHFHNDNSVAVLRDIPQLVLCVPSHPADAPELLHACVELAEREGRVCVFLEPIALYHTRDLYKPGDALWTAPYRRTTVGPGVVRTHGDGTDLLIVTFGNGVPMSLRGLARLAEDGVRGTVLDLRWLAPLPVPAIVEQASRFDRVLVVDETRASGGVGEGIVTALVDADYAGVLARVSSADSFIPLGPAADRVLLSEDDIVCVATRLVHRRAMSDLRELRS